MKVELKLPVPVVVTLHQDRENDEVPSGRKDALVYVITSLPWPGLRGAAGGEAP